MAAGNPGDASGQTPDVVVRIGRLQSPSRRARLLHLRVQAKRSRRIPKEIR